MLLLLGEEEAEQGLDGMKSEVLEKLSAPVSLTFEPVGRWFEIYQIQRHSDSFGLSDDAESDSSEDELCTEEENEALLFSLDPREWKNQDHYAVLGLSKLRINATENQIKRAYKRKVLKHHPDKRRKLGSVIKEDDDYFTCITKAYEILGNRIKRRSYDSIDPEFDNEVPANNANSKKNFCEVFTPIFEKNSRWSIKTPVPKLGDENSTYDEVNLFYSFWYNFDSWREYSYLDEEEKEKGECREERRWIEKQNKIARQKRKKEEMSRIRQLVDNAYACDPRIQRFKEEEKERKLAQKRARQEVMRAKAEEEERIKQVALEEERKKKEKEEAEARAQAAVVKKEKEAQKRVLKREKKLLRATAKDLGFFAEDEDEKVSNMQEVEKLAELLTVIRLQELNKVLTSGDQETAKNAFFQEVKELNAELEREKQLQLEALQKPPVSESSHAAREWTVSELHALIKGVNLFPAGTRDRWDVIANFISQHAEGCKWSGKDALKKAKDLQKNDVSLKEETQKKAFEKFKKEHKTTCSSKDNSISERYETVAEQQIREKGSNPAPWTADEQKLLEQSLKTFSGDTPDRWEKISENIPTRSKKDCIKRYKELVELVRAKKMAKDATSKSKKS